MSRTSTPTIQTQPEGIILFRIVSNTWLPIRSCLDCQSLEEKRKETITQLCCCCFYICTVSLIYKEIILKLCCTCILQCSLAPWKYVGVKHALWHFLTLFVDSYEACSDSMHCVTLKLFLIVSLVYVCC